MSGNTMTYTPPKLENSMTYFSNMDRLTKMHNSMPAEYRTTAQNTNALQPYPDPYQPRDSDLVCDDHLSSFFDFEPPQSPASFQDQLTTSNHSDLFPWNNHPLSPPSSAVLSSPKGRPFFDHPEPPPNILTNIDMASTRAQYGQVTPPDDGTPGRFSHQMNQMPSEGLPPGGVKKRKRQTTGTKDVGNTTSAKRTRKNAVRSNPHHGQAADPNDPEQLRRSKFLERNRVAASKCRQKKKQWIDKTEAQARELHSQNNSLHLLVGSLKNEVLFLKGQMVRHMGCKGSNIKTFIEGKTESFADAIRAYPQFQKDSSLTGTNAPPEKEKNERKSSIDPESDAVETSPSSPASQFDNTARFDELLAIELKQHT